MPTSGPKIRGAVEAQLHKALAVVWEELPRRAVTRVQWATAAQMHPRTLSRLLKGPEAATVDSYDRLLGAAWAITSYEIKVKLVVITGLYQIEIA